MFATDGTRFDPLNYNFTNHKLQYPSSAPMKKDTHGGEDVGVWASGPQSHLFSGHYEQNAIPLFMAHILKIGAFAENEKCSACAIYSLALLVIAMTILLKVII